MMLTLRAVVVLTMLTAASSSAIPIWELLTRQEKLGRLMYIFTHLVDRYCKASDIPDCHKVLTLYGMSNLVNEEEDGLDRMDPYQRNARGLIWAQVMKGDFRLPAYKTLYPDDSSAQDSATVEDYEEANEVQDSPFAGSSFRPGKVSSDPHPYAVRVPAPAKVSAAHTTARVAAHPSNSHPYAVWVAPQSRRDALAPGGITPSADFEPMMMESRAPPAVVQRVLAPPRVRRAALPHRLPRK